MADTRPAEKSNDSGDCSSDSEEETLASELGDSDNDNCRYNHATNGVLPNKFTVSARVRSARATPRWLARPRRLVLRGSKSPILSVYRQPRRPRDDSAPLRVMLLGEDTKMRAVGEKGLVLVSSRVRKNDTLALAFDSGAQRKRLYELVRRWIALGTFLQSLSSMESLAKGPNSVVYRCRSRNDASRRYALKRVHRTRCQRELELTEHILALSLENRALEPYLPRYDFLFEDNKAKCVTLAMQYYSGGSLADRILRSGPLAEATARSVLVSLCCALYLLHENHVLHLDVKAANILFDDAPDNDFRGLKLVDFGSGVLLHKDTTATGISSSNKMEESGSTLPSVAVTAGTYGCMAPERFEGRCGPEADVYGAGVVLFHMIEGSIPFDGTDGYQLMARNMHGHVSFGSAQWQRTSRRLRWLAQRMLEKDPTKRIALREVLKLPWLFKAPESKKGKEGASCQSVASCA